MDNNIVSLVLLCWDKIRAETVSRNTEMKTHIILLLLHVHLSAVLGLPDGLHPTPPMGWTSWNTFFEENSQERMITQVTHHTCHVTSCHVMSCHVMSYVTSD